MNPATGRKTLLAMVIFFLASVGVTRAAAVSGDASEAAPNVQHANGNVYDQVLMTGASGEVRADPEQVVRISFVDLNDDIVQVEFSGTGAISVMLEGVTGPALAAKYNQPGVLYMRGHARISISGSDTLTNVSVFSVNPTSASNNPNIFKEGETYDGVADIAEIEIAADPANPNGSTFGGIRAGNASMWSREGRTGVYAPRVHVQDVVRIGDLTAYETASPALLFGGQSQFGVLSVIGGDLLQDNQRLIQVDYQFGISFSSGTSGPIVFLPYDWTVPPQPGVGTYRYFVGHDGTGLLWVVQPQTP